MKTNNLFMLALIGLSASIIISCGPAHKIVKNNPRLIDTSGLKTSAAKNFALDLQDDGLKEIKPPLEKLPLTKFAKPYRANGRSTIAIRTDDSSRLAKKIKDLASLESFLRGEIDINVENKHGRVTVTEVAFTPINESFKTYWVQPENNGLYFISAENMAALAVTLDLSLGGEGGQYYAKIMFSVNANSPKIRLDYLTEGIFLPHYESNYDAMEQILFHVINDLRKKAFTPSAADEAKQL